jgi:Uma2 family endonuclease
MIEEMWPDHLLTIEEFVRLPEDTSRRYELQEGVLIVSPRAAWLHQRVLLHLTTALQPQLPFDCPMATDMEVVIQAGHPATIRVPDVVIAKPGAVSGNPPRLAAEQVLVAVEIISPGSRRIDTRLKPYEYAEAGIPHYWVIDLDEPLSLAAYHHAGEFGYQEAPAVTGLFETSEPFPLRVDLTELPDGPARRHGRNTDEH